MTGERKRVLFVCTGNAGRSQLAAALFGRMAGNGAAVFSAGVAPWPHLHPMAVRLLRERGFETSGLYPKPALQFTRQPMDYVVTIGSRAHGELPPMAGMPVRVHWDIDDPADADGTGREEESFRKALAQIEDRLPALIELTGCRRAESAGADNAPAQLLTKEGTT